MKTGLQMDCEWLEAEFGYPAECATYSDLLIKVGKKIATRVEDRETKAVRDTIRVSAFHLAYWLADNWWRLRWEPKREDLSWKMSHKLGAVGGGYMWPDLSFSSDGETIQIRSRPTEATDVQLVRHLEHFDSAVSAKDFEQSVDAFVESVIDRLRKKNIKEQDFVKLWNAVCTERKTPHQATVRRIEAMLGCDTGKAPDGLIEALLKDEQSCGILAVEEVASAFKEESQTCLADLWNKARPQAKSIAVPHVEKIRAQIQQGHLDGELSRLSLPWQKATRAAAIARDVWEFDPGPISSDELRERFEISTNDWEFNYGKSRMRLSAGFRNGKENQLSVLLHRRHEDSRRFALARLIGDHLETVGPQETLLPSTPAKTARQKFQRAFAQEFLCPFKDLMEFIDTNEPSDEDIENAVEHFEVSSRTVESVLVNKKIMERDILPPEA